MRLLLFFSFITLVIGQSLSSTGPDIVPTVPGTGITGTTGGTTSATGVTTVTGTGGGTTGTGNNDNTEINLTFPTLPTTNSDCNNMWDNARTLSVSANGQVDVDADQIEIRVNIDVKKYLPGVDISSSSSTGGNGDVIISDGSVQGSTGASSTGSASAGSSNSGSSSTTMPMPLPPIDVGTLPPEATPEQIASLIADVQREVSTKANQVITFLKGQNYANILSKLTTTSINLSPLYRYYNHPDDYSIGSTSRLIGYQATYSLSFRVTVESDAAGDIIDALPGQGVTEIVGLQFVVSDNLLEQTKRLAIRSATQNAFARLQGVVNSLSSYSNSNESLQMQFLQLRIVDQGTVRPYSYPNYPTAAAPTDSSSGSENSLPVVGGSTTIYAQVEVTVRI